MQESFHSFLRSTTRDRFISFLILSSCCSETTAATVAYWRFETGPANAIVVHNGADGAFSGTTPDFSGNGNSLSTWSSGGYAGYAYRPDVPFRTVSQSGMTNRFSVKNTGPYPAMFTSASGSVPIGINAQTITPAQFTIEASYKPEANGSYRTVVGRDAKNVSSTDPNLAALYLQVRPDDSVAVSFTDISGYTHNANSPPGWVYGFNFGTNPEGTNAPWYNLAAVSDGSTLRLYVNYVLVGTNDLIASGSPNRSLAKGTINGGDWTTGAWSVGRGLYAGGHTDRAYGLIDEVRISNAALTPAEFLTAPRPRIAGMNVLGTNAQLAVTGAQPHATVSLLRSASLVSPPSSWQAINSRTADAVGNCAFTVVFDPPGTAAYFAIKATVSTAPPVGALTYSLAGGSDSWPADARARIVYAMDGAVAQYNRYGIFNKHITVNYNPGVPTAQANYDGWLEFGSNPSYQQYRTALHESSHVLGVGTTWQWGANLSGGLWTGAQGVAQIRALDGPTANINSDGTHFWPYGLNYDNEGNTENFRRHVLMVRAFRQDMGIQ
jgi:hypothetical protein